jgi:hypothetical protein
MADGHKVGNSEIWKLMRSKKKKKYYVDVLHFHSCKRAYVHKQEARSMGLRAPKKL